MRIYKYLFMFLLGATCFFASCEDSTGDVEDTKWKKRNAEYIDSIAAVARANSDGTWKVFPATGLDESLQWGNDSSVFCKVIEAGNGTEHPAYTDSVSVYYSGSLVTGVIFDSNYDGKLEPDFDVPNEFLLNSTVVGFSTAVQKMVKGDTWRVYIPASLGYGGNASVHVPANSALIFDINLVSFTPVGVKL